MEGIQRAALVLAFAVAGASPASCGIVTSVIVPLHRPLGSDYNYTAVLASAIYEFNKQRVLSEIEYILISPKPLNAEIKQVRDAVRINSEHFVHIHLPDQVDWFDMLNAGWDRAQGTYVTAVAIEDRLAHPTLNLRQRYMSNRPTCDVLTVPVYHTTIAGTMYGDARSGQFRPAAALQTPIRPFNMFTWAESRRRGFTPDRTTITGIAPFAQQGAFWRNSLKQRIGNFNASLSPMTGYEYFLRASVRGQILCYLAMATQAHYEPINVDLEYGDRMRYQTEELIRTYSRFVALRVLLVNEVPLSGVEGSHVRMGQLVQEVVDAGHRLTYISRDTAWSWEMAKVRAGLSRRDERPPRLPLPAPCRCECPCLTLPRISSPPPPSLPSPPHPPPSPPVRAVGGVDARAGRAGDRGGHPAHRAHQRGQLRPRHHGCLVLALWREQHT
jgi:hypothetical protein